MTGTTERIRWIDSPDTSTTAFIGWAGSIHESQFAIYRPDHDGGDYILASQLSGLDEKRSYGTDTDKLKAEAERWLEEFVSSLGAVFPLGPVVSRCACGGLASHQHGCRWRQGYGSLIEVVTDATPAPMAGEKEAGR